MLLLGVSESHRSQSLRPTATFSKEDHILNLVKRGRIEDKNKENVVPEPSGEVKRPAALLPECVQLNKVAKDET